MKSVSFGLIVILATPFMAFGAQEPAPPADVTMTCQLLDVAASLKNPGQEAPSKDYVINYGMGQKLIDLTGEQKISVSLSHSEQVEGTYDLTFYFRGPSLMLARATSLTLTADRKAGAYILYRDSKTKKRYGLFCGI